MTLRHSVIPSLAPIMSPPHMSWRLPAPAARIVFGSLTVGERLRCREVCTTWRDALDTDPPTWAHLDMRPLATLPLAAQGQVLRAAAARARGQVRSIALAIPKGPRGEEVEAALAEFIPAEQLARESQEAATALRNFMDDQLVPVLRENRHDQGLQIAVRTLTLPARRETLAHLSCVDEDGEPARLHPTLARELLEAAPKLRSLHCALARSGLEDEAVAPLLRREGVFAPVRLSGALITLTAEGERAHVDALKAHDGLEQLVLIAAPGVSVQLLGHALDAAAAARVERLTVMASPTLEWAPLARVLRGGALRELFIANSTVEEADATAFADALRQSVLRKLVFLESGVMADTTRAVSLLAALEGHATLEELSIEIDPVVEAGRAPVGAALAALVAANTTALKRISINSLELGDDAMRPVAEALRSNTHLEVLDVQGNALTPEFLVSVLAMAALPCPSLKELPPLSSEDHPLERVLQMLRRRATAQGAAQDAP